MFKFESDEGRDELFPEAGPAAQQMSAQIVQWMATHVAISRRTADVLSGMWDPVMFHRLLSPVKPQPGRSLERVVY
jgi:hypothetical protein